MKKLTPALRSPGFKSFLFTLRGKRAVACNDVLQWAKWREKADCRVALTMVGKVRISTVFLGVNIGYGPKPLIFETMVFSNSKNLYQKRYSTWSQAEVGHKQAVTIVKGKKIAH